MTPSVLIGALLLVLTVVVLSLWRETSVLEERLRTSGVRVVDGPEIGTLVPVEMRSFNGVYLFVSESCPACHEVAARLRESEEPLGVSVRAVCMRDDADDGLREGSSVMDAFPPVVERIPSQTGDHLVAALSIRATPLALGIRDGLVVSKGYLRGPADVAEIGRPVHRDRRMANDPIASGVPV